VGCFSLPSQVHIYSKMMSVIIPVVVEGTIPGVEDLARSEQFGGRSGYGAASVEAAKGFEAERAAEKAAKAEKAAAKAAAKAAKAGGNQLQDKDKTTGGAFPARCPASGALASSGAKCPASGGGGGSHDVGAFEEAAYEPVSVTLQEHFAHSAASHMAHLRDAHNQRQQSSQMSLLSPSAHHPHGSSTGTPGPSPPSPSPAPAPSNPADKYRQLKVVLGVAQQVEVQLRDQGAEAISGASLLHLMVMSEFVPSRAQAIQTAQQMLQMQLMFPITSSNGGSGSGSRQHGNNHMHHHNHHHTHNHHNPNQHTPPLRPVGDATATGGSDRDVLHVERADMDRRATVSQNAVSHIGVVSTITAAAAAAANAVPVFQADETSLYSFGAYRSSGGTQGSDDETSDSHSSSNGQHTGMDPRCYVRPAQPVLIMHALDDMGVPLHGPLSPAAEE
jgi:hypothetical protein